MSLAEPEEQEDAALPSEAAHSSEAAHPSDAVRPSAERPAKRGGTGRALAALTLLLSLAAAGIAGFAGWLAWQAATRDAVAALDERFAAQTQRESVELRALRTELEALALRTEENLAALRESHAQHRDLVAEAAAESREADPRRWRLAEAEYLMRVANHRLLMERDADGAENLLALADEVLADAGALAYHDVRALLAEEMAALRAFESVDVQGIFLRLEALKGQIEQLPLRLPAYSAPRPVDKPAQEEESSALDTLFRRIGGLVRFRRHDGEAVRPLLAPRQAEYLELNLRLALDRAQLAALRHDREVHRASVTAARDWLRRFVDPTRPATEHLLRELDALLAIDFGGEPPDISRSLSRLRASRTAQDDHAVPDAT